jgi:hypothetical protein
MNHWAELNQKARNKRIDIELDDFFIEIHPADAREFFDNDDFTLYGIDYDGQSAMIEKETQFEDFEMFAVERNDTELVCELSEEQINGLEDLIDNIKGRDNFHIGHVSNVWFDRKEYLKVCFDDKMTILRNPNAFFLNFANQHSIGIITKRLHSELITAYEAIIDESNTDLLLVKRIMRIRPETSASLYNKLRHNMEEKLYFRPVEKYIILRFSRNLPIHKLSIKEAEKELEHTLPDGMQFDEFLKWYNAFTTKEGITYHCIGEREFSAINNAINIIINQQKDLTYDNIKTELLSTYKTRINPIHDKLIDKLIYWKTEDANHVS